MLFNQRLISTVEPGIEPGDRKVESILNINTISDENCVDTYAPCAEGKTGSDLMIKTVMVHGFVIGLNAVMEMDWIYWQNLKAVS
ncbi:hypothetical protein BB987_04395 [Photorhabdus temperata]|nr:hypothetical protein BB987_04395 [Photorhabdus temperata]